MAAFIVNGIPVDIRGNPVGAPQPGGYTGPPPPSPAPPPAAGGGGGGSSPYGGSRLPQNTLNSYGPSALASAVAAGVATPQQAAIAGQFQAADNARMTTVASLARLPISAIKPNFPGSGVNVPSLGTNNIAGVGGE